MKHAGPDALVELDATLGAIRALPGLQEKRPGVFYLRSRAFLHFHEDSTGLYADIRQSGSEFERRRVTTKAERASLVAAARRATSAGARDRTA